MVAASRYGEIARERQYYIGTSEDGKYTTTGDTYKEVEEDLEEYFNNKKMYE